MLLAAIWVPERGHALNYSSASTVDLRLQSFAAFSNAMNYKSKISRSVLPLMVLQCKCGRNCGVQSRQRTIIVIFNWRFILVMQHRMEGITAESIMSAFCVQTSASLLNFIQMCLVSPEIDPQLSSFYSCHFSGWNLPYVVCSLCNCKVAVSRSGIEDMLLLACIDALTAGHSG